MYVCVRKARALMKAHGNLTRERIPSVAYDRLIEEWECRARCEKERSRKRKTQLARKALRYSVQKVGKSTSAHRLKNIYRTFISTILRINRYKQTHVQADETPDCRKSQHVLKADEALYGTYGVRSAQSCHVLSKRYHWFKSPEY